eukprot:CAMPEP_0172816282 /NCGR_PEP_ID=MMETSP1075-20121228/12352_1 /TAXON_ID=2916 /ORGANISM="Ceratium fusus, Strain PA161109" /LENGTH=252 /DNA_ID=CAMNT_0013656245 /DNA_START=223 /DNA_END=978 /DNA_ORIENTATION=-
MIKLVVTHEASSPVTALIEDWSTIEILKKTRRDNGCSKVYTAHCASGLLMVTSTCDYLFKDLRALNVPMASRETNCNSREDITVNKDILGNVRMGRITNVRFVLVEISGLANPLYFYFQGRDRQSLMTSGECGKTKVPTWVLVNHLGRGIESRILDIAVQQDQYVQCTSVSMKGTCSPLSQHEGFTVEERCVELGGGFDIQMGLRAPREDGCNPADGSVSRATLASGGYKSAKTPSRGPGVLTCCRRCACHN